MFKVKFSPRLKDKEEQGRKRRIKGDTMAQWMNLFRNSIFVNPPPLPVLCEISGPVDRVGTEKSNFFR